MHSKQWHYSLHRDFQNCYFTRRSPTGFFNSNSSSNASSNSTRVPIQHLHLHVCTLHYTSIQRILHPEIQFYMQKTESSSSTAFQKRNSTHRRQGDLLESIRVSYKTFQALQPQVLTKATPVTPETFQSFRHSRHSSLSNLSRHSSRSRHSRDIPDIPVIHDLPAFPGNSTNSTLFQYLQGFHPSTAFSD